RPTARLATPRAAVAAHLVSNGRSMAEMLLRPAPSGARGAECPASSPSALPGFPKAYAQHLPSMPVPDSTSLTPQQRLAAARLLAAVSPVADELGALFARRGHALALVGGSVRDVFLGREPAGDLDLTTDAVPERVQEIIDGWADQVWTIGIEFGTVGMVKDGRVLEITTYRSEQYGRESRKPE